jgi:hypothetical protein
VLEQRFVAIGLLTEDNIRTLGATLTRVWPVDEAPCFSGLIEAIDEADRGGWRKRDRREAIG